MSFGDCTLLIFLCNLWCLIRGTSVMIPDVAVRCAEEAVLPCKALQDPSISYQTVSWYKMAEDGKGIAWEVLDVESHYPQEVEGSLELSNGTSFSLRIKNVTSRSSGTYKCTLEGQNGERNLSTTVTLKVTGCPGIEEDKLKKYRSELLMLTFLGVFYLLLIFFTCTCLRKESMSPNERKPRPDMKHMLTFINVHEITTFQHLNNNNTCKNELTSSSV
ncbi:CD83 antigen [Sylvia atricapilla]|uniref:CD83 antigen n=1 Tax=Sylvia atricapilla TaxID=48155 RepID=UPI0033918B99